MRGKLGGVPFWLFAHGDDAGEYWDPVGPGPEHRDAPYCPCQLSKSRTPEKGAREMKLIAQIERFPLGDPEEPVTDYCAYVLQCPECRQASLVLDG